jgi:hypothetical protein
MDGKHAASKLPLLQRNPDIQWQEKEDTLLAVLEGILREEINTWQQYVWLAPDTWAW